MPVFSRFDPTRSGNVNAQAHPNVYVYPWIPTQKSVRGNPLPAGAYGNTGGFIVNTTGKNFGTRIQRIQPNEKPQWFARRGYSFSPSSPARDSGCGSYSSGRCSCKKEEPGKVGV